MDNSTDSDLTRAFAAMKREDYESARQLLVRAVASGDHGGAVHLGWLWGQGLGGPVNIESAMQCYELARAHDRCAGSYYLGSLLMRQGQNERARQLLEEAAQLGHASAAYWAYVLNADAANQPKARQFLVCAAQLGHAFAQRDLARQQMREAASFGKWVSAVGRYWRAKVLGASMVLRDAHDPRVR